LAFTDIVIDDNTARMDNATQTTLGTKAIDTFMSLVATTRKLEISFFEYVRDRISKIGKLPSLATIIREKSSGNPFGWSWQPE